MSDRDLTKYAGYTREEFNYLKSAANTPAPRDIGPGVKGLKEKYDVLMAACFNEQVNITTKQLNTISLLIASSNSISCTPMRYY